MDWDEYAIARRAFIRERVAVGLPLDDPEGRRAVLEFAESWQAGDQLFIPDPDFTLAQRQLHDPAYTWEPTALSDLEHELEARRDARQRGVPTRVTRA